MSKGGIDWSKVPEDVRSNVDRLMKEAKPIPPGMEFKFPPMPYGPEWWESLTPEQRAEAMAYAVQASARFTLWLQSCEPLFRAMGQALNNFAKSVGPLLEAIQKVGESHDESQG